MNRDAPIFLDPEHRRWRVVRLGMILIGLVALVVGAVLISSVLSEEQLPSLKLDLNHRIFGQHSQALQKALPTTEEKSETKPLKTSRRSSSLKAAPRVIGFYVNWDDNSFTSLKQNIQNLDVLMPEWLHLAAEAQIKIDDPLKQTKALELIRQVRPKLPIDALINNYNSATQDWDSQGLAKNLSGADSRTRIIDQLQAYVERYKLSGVNIDFENVPDEAQRNLVLFMRELLQG